MPREELFHDVLKVLSALCPIEQAGCPASSDNGTLPVPMITWRYTGEPGEAYSMIQRCIESYAGRVRWVVRGGGHGPGHAGRNYRIEPEYAHRDGLATAHVSVEYFAEHEVAIVDSYEDLPGLARHIAGCIGIDYDACVNEARWRSTHGTGATGDKGAIADGASRRAEDAVGPGEPQAYHGGDGGRRGMMLMRLAILDRLVEVRRWDSFSQLSEYLWQLEGGTTLLGDRGTWSTAYSITLYKPASKDTARLGIGILCSVPGIAPLLLPLPAYETLMIAYDNTLSVFDINTAGIMRLVEFESPIVTFQEMPSASVLLVLTESSVSRITSDGGIVWELGTNLIQSAELHNGTVLLETEDGTIGPIDACSGEPCMQG